MLSLQQRNRYYHDSYRDYEVEDDPFGYTASNTQAENVELCFNGVAFGVFP